MNKELICEAFCAALDIRAVPAGFAVKTPYGDADGEPILIYFVKDQRGRWRIEDDGTRVPWLEASGVDISGKARGEAFDALLEEYGANFDSDTRTIFTSPLSEEQLGPSAVQFSALLLRLQDLALLSPQIVRNTFKEDAIMAIHNSFDGLANVSESELVSKDFVGEEADIIIRNPDKTPVVIYLATSEERALHALVTKMETEKYRRIDSIIVLIVERSKQNPVRETTYSLAMSRLDAVLSFREAADDTMIRLKKLAQVGEQDMERGQVLQ